MALGAHQFQADPHLDPSLVKGSWQAAA